MHLIGNGHRCQEVARFWPVSRAVVMPPYWIVREKHDGIVSMNMRRATIRDVAETAGVGVATVSRVLSGGSASPETRERVLTVAAQLDYRPSALGRNLR